MSVLDNMLVADSNAFGELPYHLLLRRKNKKREEEKTEKAKMVFEDLFGKDNDFWTKRMHKAGALSYGQQRLLGLARLLMGHYKLLLLDEPTAGVNPSTIQKNMQIIQSFVHERDLTVFLIEHNMKVVLDIADFCCFMSYGKIVALGTADDVIGNDEVRTTYMGG